MARRAAVLVVAAVVAVATLAGCGGSGSGGTEPVDLDTEPADPGTESGTVVELVVDDGGLVGGARRESATLGENVTVRVSGDSTDEVHVHGYDLYVPLENGAGEITFPALIPGIFEIELEGSGTLLVQLEVS